MGYRDHFVMFAHYNRWANGRVYDAVQTLDPADISRDRGAFFGSILGTLNHILVGDRLWMQRISGEPDDVPNRLDAVLFEDFAALRENRAFQDDRIVRVVENFSEDDILGLLSYRNTRGDAFEQPLAQVLAHYFNHQTHHRGQVHHMLGETGMEPPELDLIFYLRRAHG
jgi:uncharacterized damage-inducible protein DinB